MIVGELSEYNEISVTLSLRNEEGEDATVAAILDTGFSSYLVIPQNVVERLALPQIDLEDARMADGRLARFSVHEVTVLWHGEERQITAYAGDDIALLGVAMLRGSVTTLDFVDSDTVTIEAG